MPYFQNPFDTEFIGSLLVAERHLGISFTCRSNSGRGTEKVVSWGKQPSYDLSGTDADGNDTKNLSINIAKFDSLNNYKLWSTVTVDISAGAASVSAVTPDEIVAALNEDSNFQAFLVAQIYITNGLRNIAISLAKPNSGFKFYVINGAAETLLLFNKFAGVSELPTFFSRHTVEKRFDFDDGLNLLIELDTASDVNKAIIDAAVDVKGKSLGFDSSTVRADYELIGGRSSAFTFKKQTVDSSSRVTQIIEYPAGAVVGSLARKTSFTYTGAKTSPDQITEEPYVLQSGDLVTP